MARKIRHNRIAASGPAVAAQQQRSQSAAVRAAQALTLAVISEQIECRASVAHSQGPSP
jgi:hypothetical protein